MAREVEAKLLVDGLSFDELVDKLLEIFKSCKSYQLGSSVDCYWPSPTNPSAFLRLRVSEDADLTVKVNDRGSVSDRAEHTIPLVYKDKDVALEAMTAFLGDPKVLMFRWADFVLQDGTVVSAIYNIEKPEWIFAEVEVAGDYPVVLATWLKKLSDEGIDYKVAKNSFYDIFVKREGVRL